MHYQDLTIRNFRGIKELTLPQLGRVNLLTGKNNTGKTSVLEALQLHAQNGAPSAIYDILSFREETSRHSYDATDPVGRESSFELSTLFHGFPPSLSDDIEPIHFSASSKENIMKLTMLVDWGMAERDYDGSRWLTNQRLLFSTGTEEIPILRVVTEYGERVHQLETLRTTRHGTRISRSVLMYERMPCQIVRSNASQRTNALGPLWDKIALTDWERDIVEALRIFDPNIEDFSMIGWGNQRSGTAMVRATNVDHPVPLRSFGDGMNRMLSIMLSLINAAGGILLVDEFENGLHYSVQPDAWRMVFKLVRDLDVQVFTTTHSRDAISSFQEVAAECEDLGVLIRLNRRGDDIIPVVYSEDELAIANRHAIEVR